MGKKKNFIGRISSLNLSLMDIKSDSFDDEDEKEKKKKKIKVRGPVPYEQMKRDADCYESYLNAIETYCILKNLTVKKYEKTSKRVRKMIKYLREGRGDKVYDEDAYREYLRRTRGDDMY